MTDGERDARASAGRTLRGSFGAFGSQRRLLGCASLIVVGWLLAAAMGGRVASVALSGTAPVNAQSVIGVAYVIGWLALVLVAPILVLTAALLALIEYARRSWSQRSS